MHLRFFPLRRYSKSLTEGEEPQPVTSERFPAIALLASSCSPQLSAFRKNQAAAPLLQALPTPIQMIGGPLSSQRSAPQLNKQWNLPTSLVYAEQAWATLPSFTLSLRVSPSPNPGIHLHRLTPPHYHRPHAPLSALAPSRHQHTKEGSGLVALWWMHFHRPISVILVKQVSASILSGLYSFFSATHPPTPFLHFFSHLLPPSLHPPSPFFEGHSLILLSIDADPATLSFESPACSYWASKPMSHRSHPVLSKAAWLAPTPPRSRTGWHRAPKQWEALPLHIHMDTQWDVPSLDWLAMRNIPELINFIYLMQMRQTQEFTQRSQNHPGNWKSWQILNPVNHHSGVVFHEILSVIFKLSLKENWMPFCLMNLPFLCNNFLFGCWWMADGLAFGLFAEWITMTTFLE